MFCTKERLVRALDNYRRYQPTASESLREARQKWIPVHVRRAADKKRVREVAEGILQGTLCYGVDCNVYEGLREEHRLAVALVLIQTWADLLWEMHEKGAREETTLTQRVYAFLAYIPVEHAELCVRNWGQRDGGRVPAMQLLVDMKSTRVPEVMRVYQAISNKWSQRGFDWERRAREEAQLTHSA